MWDGFVELLRLAIFSAAHLCAGSLGTGIVLVSVGLRLALLPLTLRLVRQSREQQARLDRLRPQLEALQRRHSTDAVRLMRETRTLHAKNGIRLLTPTGVGNILIQLPVLGGLFAAVREGLGTRVRFLWIGDLARPDVLLLIGATLLTGVATMTMPLSGSAGKSSAPTIMLLVVTVSTVVFLWSASSAVALSVGGGSLVTMLQNWLISRDKRSPA